MNTMIFDLNTLFMNSPLSFDFMWSSGWASLGLISGPCSRYNMIQILQHQWRGAMDWNWTTFCWYQLRRLTTAKMRELWNLRSCWRTTKKYGKLQTYQFGILMGQTMHWRCTRPSQKMPTPPTIQTDGIDFSSMPLWCCNHCFTISTPVIPDNHRYLGCAELLLTMVMKLYVQFQIFNYTQYIARICSRGFCCKRTTNNPSPAMKSPYNTGVTVVATVQRGSVRFCTAPW